MIVEVACSNTEKPCNRCVVVQAFFNQGTLCTWKIILFWNSGPSSECNIQHPARMFPNLVGRTSSIRLRTNVRPMSCRRVLIHGLLFTPYVLQGIRSTDEYLLHVLQRVFVVQMRFRPMFMRGHSFQGRMFAAWVWDGIYSMDEHFLHVFEWVVIRGRTLDQFVLRGCSSNEDYSKYVFERVIREPLSKYPSSVVKHVPKIVQVQL